MSRLDHIEKLIVRHLDGEATGDEELELNRELLRSPEAHRLFEEYQRIDELGGAVLKEALSGAGPAFDPAQLAGRSAPRRFLGRKRIWWLLPGAVAAALAGLIVPHPTLRQSPDMIPSVAQLDVARPATTLDQNFQNRRPLMRTVRNSLPRVRRNTGRQVFGVVGDDGSIYWIEVDRTRTVRRRGVQTSNPPPDGAL